MGFNRRKMEDQRREAAEKEAATRRATDAQVLEDAERLIAAWNERQALRAPMIFSPTIGAAIAAGYWFLWIRCPACRTINAIDLRTPDRHRDAAVTSLIPLLSCRSCRPNAPFAELVRLSRTSIADEMREEHRRRVLRVKLTARAAYDAQSAIQTIIAAKPTKATSVMIRPMRPSARCPRTLILHQYADRRRDRR